MKVDAATGRSQPFVDTRALAKGLSRLSIARLRPSTVADRSPARHLVRHGPGQAGLPVRARPGPLLRDVRRLTAVRLTNQPGREQWPQFSPDGKTSRSSATSTCTSSTSPAGGAPADHRRPRRPAPRAGRLGLLRGDLQPSLAGVLVESRLEAARVHGVRRRRRAAITRCWTTLQRHARKVEQTHYPRSGEPNPKVRLGIVGGAGGPVQWADLSDYSAGSFLISEVGWWPDSSAAYCYVQNRIQTWLDLVKFTPESGETGPITRLFRDATKAWIDSPGPMHWLQGRHVPLAQRARRLEAYLPVRRRRHAEGPAHVGPVGGPPAGARRSRGRLDLLHRHARSPMSTNFYRVKPGGPVERLTQTPAATR